MKRYKPLFEEELSDKFKKGDSVIVKNKEFIEYVKDNVLDSMFSKSMRELADYLKKYIPKYKNEKVGIIYSINPVGKFWYTLDKDVKKADKEGNLGKIYIKDVAIITFSGSKVEIPLFLLEKVEPVTIDWNDQRATKFWNFYEKGIKEYISKMAKSLGYSSEGLKNDFFYFGKGVFRFIFSFKKDDTQIGYRMTGEYSKDDEERGNRGDYNRVRIEKIDIKNNKLLDTVIIPLPIFEPVYKNHNEPIEKIISLMTKTIKELEKK